MARKTRACVVCGYLVDGMDSQICTRCAALTGQSTTPYHEDAETMPSHVTSKETPKTSSKAPSNAQQYTRKILIVAEPNKQMRDLTIWLRDAGYDCAEAHDGPAALKEITRYKPNFMIVDVLLDGIMSLDFIKKIRKLEGDERFIPIIILSDHPEMELYFKPAQIVGYLRAPSQQKKVLDMIRSLDLKS